MHTAAAILVAAGPGTRLGAGLPKAFVDLAGVPLFVHSLQALFGAPSIIAAVVVVPPGGLDHARRVLDQHGPWRSPPVLVAGGAERAISVRNGLAALPDAELIAVHDAARPFVGASVIEAAIAAAGRHGAAIVAVPATDTVKQIHAEGWVAATPPRQQLWLAQTPQVFRAEILRAAHEQADASAATDDAMLVEALGERVYVVPGHTDNRKITTPEDLRWAEWRLGRG